MNTLSQAEQVLLEQIRQGQDQAWSQLVDRYQGRLLSFARARLGQRHDCDDILQETFIAFLKGLPTFRGDCTLETYLFTLLRRKIIDSYRRRAAQHICLIQDVYDSHNEEDTPSDALDRFEATDPTVSWYAQHEEQTDQQRQVLEQALQALVNGYKKSVSLLELKIIEAIFYGHLANGDTAKLLQVSPNRVGVIKHRSLKQIHKHVATADLSINSASPTFETLLTDIWQTTRLSCPKRNTVGAYLLNTLDRDWHEYVDFHLHVLGCHFCRANFDDLKQQNDQAASPRSLHVRIMESTIGFLNKP